jgi:hypothetical protein
MSGIALALFGASTGVPVNPLLGGTFSAVSSTPADATATLSFNENGTVSGTGVGHNWFTGGGTPGATKYIRATVSAGVTPSTGTVGSIVSLAGGRTWTNTQTIVGSRSSTLLIEIFADAAGTIPLTSGTYTLIATEST